MADIQLRTAEANSSELAEIMSMADDMRDALVAGRDWSDPQSMGFAMVAAAMLSGMMFGQLIAMGAAREQDRRKVGESILANFRMGTEAGRSRAARIAAEMGIGAMEQ